MEVAGSIPAEELLIKGNSMGFALIFYTCLLIVVVLSFLYALYKGGFSYQEKCPRCHQKASVRVYGSADQWEDVSCSCGYKIVRVT